MLHGYNNSKLNSKFKATITPWTHCFKLLLQHMLTTHIHTNTHMCSVCYAFCLHFAWVWFSLENSLQAFEYFMFVVVAKRTVCLSVCLSAFLYLHLSEWVCLVYLALQTDLNEFRVGFIIQTSAVFSLYWCTCVHVCVCVYVECC